jgi:hypothetical protein
LEIAMTLEKLQSAVNAFAKSIADEAWADGRLKVAARELYRATLDRESVGECPYCGKELFTDSERQDGPGDTPLRCFPKCAANTVDHA